MDRYTATVTLITELVKLLGAIASPLAAIWAGFWATRGRRKG